MLQKIHMFGWRSYCDYSGYDRHLWTLRNYELHRQHCQEMLNETTKTGMRKKESEFGVRYSVLLSLPYFDPVWYTVVDIMHNLFWERENMYSNYG